jgi:hypothetical protein
VRIAFTGTDGYEGVFNEVHALKTICDVSEYEIALWEVGLLDEVSSVNTQTIYKRAR